MLTGKKWKLRLSNKSEEQPSPAALISVGQLLSPGLARSRLTLQGLAGGTAFYWWESNMVYPTDEQIRELAHRLWSEAGQPEGREQEFWHLAKQQLQSKETQPNQPDFTG